MYDRASIELKQHWAHMVKTSKKKTTGTTARKTTPKTTLSAKPKTPVKTAAPVVSPVTLVEPKVVTPAEPVVTAGSMRKPDLISSVVARTGAKPRGVKPIVDAVLATLGEAIADGQELNLPPMGKLKLQRTKETDKARITIAKLRQPKV